MSERKLKILLVEDDRLALQIYSEVLAEDVKPTINILENLLRELKDLIPQLVQLNGIYEILSAISAYSRKLLNTQKYVSDVNVGLWGSSDVIREGQFGFSKFYYFNEDSFDLLVNSIVYFIHELENKGSTTLNKNTTYEKIIVDVVDITEIAIHLSNSILPNTLFVYPPEIFENCIETGKKLYSHLTMFRFSKKLVELYDEIDGAIVGFRELAEKYKNKPKKKIHLDAIFFTKEGANQLYEILKETRKYFKK